MSKDRNELSFDEMTRARGFFMNHAEEYITEDFQLRTILSEMGQYPNEKELRFCLDSFDNKLSFNNFCNYLMYLKNRYQRPEPKDVDTLRAFVALGGKQDRGGDISTEDLRATCKHFELTIDIDRMLREVDEDGSGTIDYEEFASMWQLGKQQEVEEEIDPEEAKKKLLRRVSSLKIDAEPPLDDDDNLNAVKQFLFPLQRKATVIPSDGLGGKRKSNVNQRKSVARLPSLYPGANQAPRNKQEDITSVESDEEEEAEKIKAAPAAQQPMHRQSNAYRPPSPQILDFRRSHKNKNSSLGKSSSPRRGGTKLPILTPRAPGGSQVNTGRTPRTARTRY